MAFHAGLALKEIAVKSGVKQNMNLTLIHWFNGLLSQPVNKFTPGFGDLTAVRLMGGEK